MARNSGVERRRHKRYRVSLEAQVRVPLPEEGSATLVAKATIRDLSENGANLHIRKIKKQHIPAFVRARRKCSVVCLLPGSETPLVLSGEIVWTDVHAEQTPFSAIAGIELTNTHPDERRRLLVFLATLEKA